MDDSRELYREILQANGFVVLEAADGFGGLALAFGEHPDVIVMDLCMPHMDGWEAIRRLKSDPRTTSVPIVVLTALGWQGSAEGLDCEAYLVKPCMPSDLLGVVESLLSRAPMA